MILTHLHIRNFRNIKNLNADLDEELTIIKGKNAIGKTNFLESIYYVCKGKGIKEGRQDELVAIGEDDMEVVADFVEKDSKTHEQTDSLQARVYFSHLQSVKRSLTLDGSRKQLHTYTDATPNTVLFSPKRIHIIDGETQLRRKYFDGVLSSIDVEYKKRLINYENGLRRRNKVLEKEHASSTLKDSLHFWNNYLIENGTYLQEKRTYMQNMFNNFREESNPYRMEYVPSELSEQRFDEKLLKEIYQKRTLIGPQRDEYNLFKIYDQKRMNVHTYCSRGEQRIALFWLLMFELYLNEVHTLKKPILLLDDIMSELDKENRTYIFPYLKKYQTVITTMDSDGLGHLKHGKVIELEDAMAE